MKKPRIRVKNLIPTLTKISPAPCKDYRQDVYIASSSYTDKVTLDQNHTIYTVLGKPAAFALAIELAHQPL